MDRPAMNRTRAAARVALPALAVLVALGLAGCGGSSADAVPSPAASSPGDGQKGATTSATTSAKPVTPSAGGATDPCALVSKPEAEQLAGTALNSPVSLAGTCTYTAPPNGPSGQVEIFAGETAKNYLAAERGLGHDLQPLPGIGDEGYVEDYAVFVEKAGFWVSIDLTRSNDPAENRQPLEDLARAVAGRI
jgi:hypothetical protein